MVNYIGNNIISKIVLTLIICIFNCLITFSPAVLASTMNIRKCSLLPIVGTAKDSFKYEVFTEVETFIKRSWTGSTFRVVRSTQNCIYSSQKVTVYSDDGRFRKPKNQWVLYLTVK